MDRDLIDRRERARRSFAGPLHPASTERGRGPRGGEWDGPPIEHWESPAWEGRMLPVGSGSPASDHDRGRALIESMVAIYAAGARSATSRRRRRWRTRSGEPRSSEVVRPSRSPRDGHQPNASRNLRAYLLSVVLDLSDAEIAAELGLAGRQSARSARVRGQGLAPGLAAGLSR